MFRASEAKKAMYDNIDKNEMNKIINYIEEGIKESSKNGFSRYGLLGADALERIGRSELSELEYIYIKDYFERCGYQVRKAISYEKFENIITWANAKIVYDWEAYEYFKEMGVVYE